MPPAGPREIPSRETILAVSKLGVLNENGRAVTFGSLFEKQKTIAIFIRTLRCTTVSPLSYVCSSQVIFGVQSVPLSTLLFDRSHRYLIDMPGELTSRRHFWVSLMRWQSQSYVMQLASIPGNELDDANVRLVVIGCGSWDVIPSYRGEG